MFSLLLARDHEGKVTVIGGPGDLNEVNDKFKELVNAGREHSEYSGISLHEIDFYGGRKVSSFTKPLTDEQRKANEDRSDRTKNAVLLEEARRIQRENTDASKKIANEKKRIKPLTPEHKKALESADKPASAKAASESLDTKALLPAPSKSPNPTQES